MSVCAANPLKSRFSNNFSALILKDLMLLIMRSKTPVISAMVPPDTPGITLAVPMAKPFRKLAALFFRKFIDSLQLKVDTDNQIFRHKGNHY